jgi:hypothetical protein
VPDLSLFSGAGSLVSVRTTGRDTGHDHQARVGRPREILSDTNLHTDTVARHDSGHSEALNAARVSLPADVELDLSRILARALVQQFRAAEPPVESGTDAGTNPVQVRARRTGAAGGAVTPISPVARLRFARAGPGVATSRAFGAGSMVGSPSGTHHRGRK